MKKILESLLFRILRKNRHLDNNDLYMYALLMTLSILTMILHLGFAIFFFAAGCVPLSAIHLVGVLVFVLSYALLKNNRFDLSGAVLAFMILISSVCTVVFVGNQNLTVLYPFTVLLILLVVPFKRRAIPWTLGSILPLLAVCIYLSDRVLIPLFDIGRANTILAVANILVFFQTVVVLLLLEKSIHSFVSSYLHEQVQELQNQANMDPLTGLANRRYAEAYFNQLSHTGKGKHYVVMIDIDDFKQVNDTYGHEAGDLVLKEISSIMSQNMRKSDLVARWGGEEFLLVICDTEKDAALRVLNKVHGKIGQHVFTTGDDSFSVTVTAGMSEYRAGQTNKCIDECDRKLYSGKKGGKNCVVFSIADEDSYVIAQPEHANKSN